MTQPTTARLLVSLMMVSSATAVGAATFDKRWLMSLGAKCAVETAGDAFELGYVKVQKKDHWTQYKPWGSPIEIPVSDIAKTIATYGCEEALDTFGPHAVNTPKGTKAAFAKDTLETLIPVIVSHLIVESALDYHAAKKGSRLDGNSIGFLSAKLLLETIKGGLITKACETFGATSLCTSKPFKTVTGFGRQLAPIFEVNKQEFNPVKFTGKTVSAWLGGNVGDCIGSTDSGKKLFAKKHREKAVKKLIGLFSAPLVAKLLDWKAKA